MLWRVFVGYNQELVKEMADLQSQSMYSMKGAVMYRQRRKELQALKPKLQVIEKRLKSISNTGASGLSTETVTGDILFDASKLFDALDEDKNGDLSYKELNTVLKLEPIALREFTNRMNQAGKAPPGTNTISRPVFTRYFLTALQASSHFQPTPEEASILYDRLSEEAKQAK